MTKATYSYSLGEFSNVIYNCNSIDIFTFVIIAYTIGYSERS